jgi:hypothetical protein
MRYIGGIDPGLTGALAVLDFQDFRLHLWDTPTTEVRVGDKIRKRCNVDAFVEAMAKFPIDYGVIENVQSTPNDGHVGAFTFGKVTGIAIGIAAGLDIPLAGITPAKWKMQMQVPADKEAATRRASQLFPNCTGAWSRKMDHGRAEASIIALYAAILNGLSPSQPFQLGLINGTVPKRKPTK